MPKRHLPYFFLFCATIFSTPFFVGAQVVITEIMYDAEGADTGHEWIEIYNTGGESVDIKNWKFFEADTNHGLVSIAGGTSIPAGGYAIIADNGTQFLTDFPSFSGVVFDSSFSLKNDGGEVIAIRNDALENVDILTYNPALGAGGDGMTLQKNGNAWTALSATPGAGGSAATPETSNTTTTTTETESSSSATAPSSNRNFPVEPQIYANAGSDRTVQAGADVVFEGQAFGIEKKPLPNARFIWNFGDGGTKEGQSVLYHYAYPGEYIVVLDVASGKFSASDRARVRVIPTSISISAVSIDTNPFIELSNTSQTELDISWWRLRAGENHFTIPKNTFIPSKSSIRFAASITGLAMTSFSDVTLLYPNGELAYRYGTEVIDMSPVVPIKEESILAYTASPDTHVTKESASTRDREESDPSEEVIDNTSSALTASVSAFPEMAGEASLTKWLLSLFGVTFAGVVGVIFMRRKEEAMEGLVNADEITILD
ncbi:MAG: lamin tail domain-containing protein [Patescibacteria group bacterium]|nr:lamin tail domain-containing protein [Patescibacteria group bacterium]